LFSSFFTRVKSFDRYIIIIIIPSYYISFIFLKIETNNKNKRVTVTNFSDFTCTKITDQIMQNIFCLNGDAQAHDNQLYFFAYVNVRHRQLFLLADMYHWMKNHPRLFLSSITKSIIWPRKLHMWWRLYCQSDFLFFYFFYCFYVVFSSFFNCLIESSIFIRYMVLDNDTTDALKKMLFNGDLYSFSLAKE
jgi:hypothetical protein